jgi:GNAT superfamily N-acetyltransferase
MPEPTQYSAISIRPLASADVPKLLDLVDALADYEHLPRPEADARARLTRDATADQPRFRALIAELSGQPVAYAIYFYTYSTFLARPTLYLEDIFVRSEARGRGVGRAIFRALAREAAANDCGRIEWQVLTWNEPAIGFYERLGARRMTEWHSYRLDAEDIARLG